MSELVFHTSGSTGAPQAWVRTADQVAAEGELLARLCAGGEPVDAVVCFAPPEHLYGYLMSQVLPGVLGVPVRLAGLTDAPADVFAGLRRPLVAALPAALELLLRSGSALGGLERLTVVHSSAVMPLAGQKLVSALRGRARLVELFGSTETGLIATRGLGSPAWTLAPDVTFAAGLPEAVETLLRVRSPRLARRQEHPVPAEYELDDIVTVADPITFRWIGRRSSLVKVNGLRVNLDAINETLRDAVPGIPITCLPERDEVRGEWFRVEIGSTDPAASTAVEAAVRGLPAWQRPRAVTLRSDILETSPS